MLLYSSIMDKMMMIRFVQMICIVFKFEIKGIRSSKRVQNSFSVGGPEKNSKFIGKTKYTM